MRSARGWRAQAAAGFGGCALAFALTVAASSHLSAQTATPTESLDVTAALYDFPPEIVLADGEPPTGSSIEALEAVAARAHLNVRYQVFDSGRAAMSAVAEGRADLLPSLGRIESRSGDFDFSVPLVVMPVSIFVRKGATDISDLDDLVGRPVGVVERNAGAAALAGRTDIPTRSFPKLSNALLALISGAVDAVAYPEFVAWKEAERLGIQEIVRVTGKPLSEVQRGMAVRKGNAALLQRLNPAISDLVGSREYGAIVSRWYGRAPPYWTPRRVGAVAALLLALTAAALTAWRFHSLVSVNRALAAKKRELRGMIDGMQAWVALCTPDGTLLQAGGPMKAADIDPHGVGRPLWDNAGHAYSEETRAQVRSAMQRAASGERVREDLRVRIGEDRFVVLDAAFGPIYDADGRVQRIVVSGVDVTERREMDAALGRSEAALLRAERLAGVGHWQWEIREDRIRWSPGMFRLFGYPPRASEDVPLELPLERVHPDDLPTVRANIDLFLESGAATATQYRIRLPNGEERVLVGEAEAVCGADGRPVTAFGFVLDITRRALAEQDLKQSQERLAAHYQSLPVPTYTWRVAGEDLQLVRWNRAAQEYAYGSVEPVEGIAASSAYAAMPEILACLRDCGRRRARLMERELDYVVRPLGVLRRCRVTCAWVPPDEVSVFVEDITERYEAERALRLSERSLAEAQRIAHLGSWEWDVITGALTWSDEVYRIFAQEPGASEPSYEGFMESIDPDDRHGVTIAIEAALQGAGYDVHFRVRLPSGEIRILHALGQAVFDAEGRPLRMLGTVQDVTELKSAETALRASLTEKTVLLREVHHRVKNNLQVISSLLYMQGRQAESPEVREILDESRERVRAMALVHETLYRSDELGRVEFGSYLDKMLAGVWSAHRTPGIETRLEAVGPPLDIEQAVPLGLVTNELVTNALKHAFPAGRRGEVRVRFRGADRGHFSLTVEDDGVGLPAGLEISNVETLGLWLVGLLASQLDAELRVERSPGARITLSRRPA